MPSPYDELRREQIRRPGSVGAICSASRASPKSTNTNESRLEAFCSAVLLLFWKHLRAEYLWPMEQPY